MTRYRIFLFIRVTLPLFVVLPLSASAQEPAPPGACHAGAYQLSDGSKLVITPSDSPDLRYRFLSGASGKLFPISNDRYESGEGWSVREPVTLHVAFGSCNEGVIRFQREHASALEGRKISLPTTPISFANGKVTLYGELVMPAKTPRRRTRRRSPIFAGSRPEAHPST